MGQINKINIPQVIKWTVYSLLLLNWALYALEEWQLSQHTLRSGGNLLDWTTAYGTTLDNMAWFGLLFIWEMETYSLDDHAWNKAIERTFLAIRGICYIFLAHTVLAWSISFIDLQMEEPLPEITSLCQLADQGMSFGVNLEYTLITQENCASLSDDTVYYEIENSAVSDRQGFRTEKINAWIDLQDAITWLLIMFTIEIGIWLQERNVSKGRLMAVSHFGKLLYGVLFFDAFYWGWRDHWLYIYDQLLWIFGFWAIEYNMKTWRDEIDQSSAERASKHEPVH